MYGFMLHSTWTAALSSPHIPLSPLVPSPPTPSQIKTAAEPRPTSYIPDQLGIPKPYGNAAPFKPTVAGSTMRHIRQPVLKPIEL